jgi:lipopolysaccharide export system protein LptC
MSSPIAEPAGPLRGMAPIGLGAEDMQRRRLMLDRWRRRSAVIKALRRILPALCVAIIVALGGWTAFNTLFSRLSAQRPGGKLAIRLLNPNFEGRNDSGRPFLITADSAVRDDADTNKVYLDKPIFTLGASPDQTHVRSIHGVYREDTRMLDLTGDVHLDDAQGYHFVTEHALIDTQKNNVDGDRHVDGHGPLGRIAASAYAVRDGGAHTYFTGQVKSRIEGRGMAAARPAPPPAATKE